MLRIISLTKDPGCLTRFLQDQVLPGSVPQADLSSTPLDVPESLFSTADVSDSPGFSCRFLTAVPRVLADIYHSLGTQLPEALLALLPSDFFSDESLAQDSVSPSASSLSSVGQLSERREDLQELRRRSASQRRWEETQTATLLDAPHTLSSSKML